MMRMISRTVCLTFMACLLAIGTSCSSVDKPTEFEFQKGVNIGNWLSQSDIMDERRLQIFTEQDIELLADNGFDHIRLPVDEVQLFNEDIGIANWGRRFAEREFLQTEQRLIPFLCTTASERYARLLEESPDLLQRLPLEHLASWLGITPVSLSRIRAKMKADDGQGQ